MYETVDVPEELKKFVPNIKINVFDIAWLTETQVNMFKSDFKIVADYFVQSRKTGKYKGNMDDIKHVYEILELLSVMEKDDRYKKAYNYQNANGGIRNMCDVLDRLEKMTIEKKKEEIREDVKKEVIKEVAEDFKETYAKKMLKEGTSQAEVARLFDLTKSKVAKLAKLVAVASV